jgi:replicative DNA helicase
MDELHGRIPPHNLDAEASVLGSILLDNEAYHSLEGSLRPEHFYKEANRKIFAAIENLISKGNPADSVTLIEELRTKDQLEEVGGVAYLVGLSDGVPTSVYAKFYADIVVEKANLRGLIAASSKIMQLAYDEAAPAEELMDRAEKLVFEVAQKKSQQVFQDMNSLVNETFEYISKITNNPGFTTGVPTGFRDLDEMTTGLQPGSLNVIAARPSMGKCLTAHTLIDDPHTGERLRLEQFIAEKRSCVFGVSSTGQVRPTRISAWIDSGVKPVFRVVTRLGREVEVTGHHPFLTVEGWTPLHDLSVGSSIAVPRVVPAFGDDSSTPKSKVLELAARVLCDHSPFPIEVWRFDRQRLTEFVKAIFAAFYHLRHAFSFSFPNQQTAKDMQHALTRLGVIAGLQQQDGFGWLVFINEPESVQFVLNTFVNNSQTTPRTPSGFDDSVSVLAYRRENQLTFDSHPDLYWDKIVSITRLEPQQVYDLTVPDGANFIAQDVCVHNTAFALSIAQNISVRQNKAVAVFSLEMPASQLVLRMMCAEARVDMNRVRQGALNEKDFERLVNAAGKLSEAPMFIDDASDLTVTELRSKSRRLMAERDLQMIVIDYLQLMSGSGTSKGGGENRQQEISSISRGLKSLARELNIPVVVLSQLSRQVESRPNHRPMLSDLRESGAIEQDADLVSFIYRDEYYHKDSEKQGIAEIIIGKQRNGPVGTVELQFHSQHVRFNDLAKDGV